MKDKKPDAKVLDKNIEDAFKKEKDDLFTKFVESQPATYEEMEEKVSFFHEETMKIKHPILEQNIDSLYLSVRCKNALWNHFRRDSKEILISELLEYSEQELLKSKNLGMKAVFEIKAELARFGLELKEK